MLGAPFPAFGAKSLRMASFSRPMTLAWPAATASGRSVEVRGAMHALHYGRSVVAYGGTWKSR